MSFDEISALLKANDKQRREEWEQLRHLEYFIISPWTDKIKQPRDLYILPWEVKEIKKIDKARLQRRSDKILKQLNKQNGKT